MEFRHNIALKGGFIFSLLFILKNFLLLISLEKSMIIEIFYKTFIILGLGILISYKLKKLLVKNNIETDFKNLFSVIFLMWITGVFISCLFDFIFYNYLFPNFSMELKDYTITQINQLGNIINNNENEIKRSIAELEESNIYSLYNIIKGFIFSIPGIAILCSLISLTLKK